MGMATGQGRIPETEVNSGGGKRQNLNFSMIKVFEIMYLIYESLLPYPYTKESQNVITGYPTGGKEKPPTLRETLRLGVSHYFCTDRHIRKEVETYEILRCS